MIGRQWTNDLSLSLFVLSFARDLHTFKTFFLSPLYHDMNSCDDGRPPFCLSVFLLLPFSCFIRISYFVGYPTRRHETGAKTSTQSLSFNTIDCILQILTAPRFFFSLFLSACLFVSLFVCSLVLFSVGTLYRRQFFFLSLFFVHIKHVHTHTQAIRQSRRMSPSLQAAKCE